MILVVLEEEDIPEWLYPGSFPEVPRLPESWIRVPILRELDFAALWHTIDPSATGREALAVQPTHCGCGVLHDAPDYVDRLNSDLVFALANLAEGERWRVAQAWANGRVGKRPNQGELVRHKELLKAICGLNKRAIGSRQPLVLLPVS
jgi:hypothetical protein